MFYSLVAGAFCLRLRVHRVYLLWRLRYIKPQTSHPYIDTQRPHGIGNWTFRVNIHRTNQLVEVCLRCMISGTPQLPYKTPQIPSNRDHTALNTGTLGGLGL